MRIQNIYGLLLLSLGCAKAPEPATKTEAVTKTEAAKDTLLALGAKLAAADAQLLTVEGAPTKLADHVGAKGTLVIFTCNHCPYAKAWEARLVEAGNQLVPQGIAVVAINPNDPVAYPEDDAETMKARISATGMKFPYLVDPTSNVARAYGATKTPEFFLFDANQILVYRGALDDNAYEPAKVSKTYLMDAAKALLGGTPIAEPSTKALGCSIKFRSS